MKVDPSAPCYKYYRVKTLRREAQNCSFAHSKDTHVINNNNVFPRKVSTESVENKLAYGKHAD